MTGLHATNVSRIGYKAFNRIAFTGLSKEEILAASMRAYDSATPKVPPASSSNDKPGELLNMIMEIAWQLENMIHNSSLRNGK